MASFDKVIPSGQEGKVTLKVKTSSFKEGKFTKSASIFSNDPKNPSLSVKLTGNVKTYITINPPRVSLSGFEGDALSSILKITNNEETPLKITHQESNIDDKIKYELKPVVEGKEYELTVNTLPALKGSARGTITLTTTSTKKPKLDIMVAINIQDELAVSPNTIHFGTIRLTTKPGEPPAQLNLTKPLTIRKARGEPFAIKKLTPSSDLLQIKQEVQEEGKIYRIYISLNREKLKQGQLDETLEIKTDYKKKPVIKVNVKGNVM